MRQVMRRMARWDAATADRVDRFVANSRHVAGRISRYYNRQATVVYPPVDTDFFHPDGTAPGDYFLVVSALVPYKRIDLAIEAAARAGVRLKIAGVGTERSWLERLAGPSVEFVGRASNEDVRDLYRGAQAVLMPGEEDFGIVPIEAQACGRPAIALAAGGALETIEDGVTGVLVTDATAESFADAIRRVGAGRIRPAGAARAGGAVFRGAISVRHDADHHRRARRAGGGAMVRRQSRLLTTYHVLADAMLGMSAFALAYALRFESGLIPITKGQPPFSQYVTLLPFVGALVPLAFQTQGLYRLRRGRSRVDDFFAVFVGTIVAVVVGQFGTLYVQTYFASDAARDRGAYRCRSTSGLFSSC